MNEFTEFVKNELVELKSKNIDTLYECIKENCQDMGVEFNTQLEILLYNEIENQLQEIL